MQTRQKAMDEQISKLAEQVTQQQSNYEQILATVQKHSEHISKNLSLTEAIQHSLAEINYKLNKLEKQPVNTPSLLPKPTSQVTSEPHSASSHRTPPTTELDDPFQSRPPKLEVSRFGGEHVLSWIFQIEHYFTTHQTQEHHKLSVAAFYMVDEALEYYHWMRRTNQLTTWSAFAKSLELRFGPSKYENHEEELYNLQQTSTVTAYLKEFVKLSARVDTIPTSNLLHIFTHGLRKDIKTRLKMFKPSTLDDAIGLAKLIEDELQDLTLLFTKLNKPRSSFQYPKQPFQALPAPPSQSIPASQNTNNIPKSSLPFRRLSTVEMQARRDKGLCYNCEEKYYPGHKCKKMLFQCILAEEEEEISVESADTVALALQNMELTHTTNSEDSPTISLYALEGRLVPSTLRIPATISKTPITILIDGGSTHNFIQTRMAAHLGLPIQPSPCLNVTVGNGENLKCDGFCKNIQIKMNGHTFTIDLYLLPIFGTDLVLGVQWLSLLGPIVFDYKDLYMEFQHQGSNIRLCGIKSSSLHTISPSQLRRFEAVHQSPSLYSLVITSPTTPTDTIFTHAPNQNLHNQILSLLHKFKNLFDSPKGLPPQRPFDHRIPLLPNTVPVNVRPYRYPHYQKNEIERIINEMLAEGIIKPSSSPFSAPVILVPKKDGQPRLCVDFRALNAVTIKDRFPIPTVDELLDELHGAKVFTRLDLRSGYHQLRVHPADTHKTAFRTHEGHYEYLVMPFGLSNAPSSFQAAMNHTFRPYLRRFVIVFFDDILVYSPSWDSHLTHLSIVFSVLQDHKFYLSSILSLASVLLGSIPLLTLAT